MIGQDLLPDVVSGLCHPGRVRIRYPEDEVQCPDRIGGDRDTFVRGRTQKRCRLFPAPSFLTAHRFPVECQVLGGRVDAGLGVGSQCCVSFCQRPGEDMVGCPCCIQAAQFDFRDTFLRPDRSTPTVSGYGTVT